MTPIISKETMAALLGRSLTTIEDTNYSLYLNIAKLRLEDLLCLTITIPLAADLQLLLARCFGAISSEMKSNNDFGIQTKKVEDFSITYEKEADAMVSFVNQNQALIAKYSECQADFRVGGRKHGNCIRCI